MKAATASPQVMQVTSVHGVLAQNPETLSYDADGNLTADGLWDYTYDADGNLTADGLWDYTYDADGVRQHGDGQFQRDCPSGRAERGGPLGREARQNRLIKMQTNSAALTAGLPGKRLILRYDSLGRRTAKELWTYGSSTWTQTKDLRFIYQGWNLIAELSPVSGPLSLVRSYVWGLDLSGSLSAMGGVGALVQITDYTGSSAVSYVPGYDGSGNLAVLVKDDGALAAAYEYSTFGESLRKEGAYAKGNPFRFSTKYTDEETGLVYYGHRYYSPSLGRFLNQDPIGVQGGVNLYAFVGNDPVNGWDYLGLDTALSPEEQARRQMLWQTFSNDKDWIFNADTAAQTTGGLVSFMGFQVPSRVAAAYAPFALSHGLRSGDLNAQFDALLKSMGVKDDRPGPTTARPQDTDIIMLPPVVVTADSAASLEQATYLAGFQQLGPWLAPNRAGARSATGSGAPVQVVAIPGVGTIVVNKYGGGAGKAGSQLTLDFDFQHGGGKDQYGILQTVTTDTFQKIKTPYADPINGPRYYDDSITSVPRLDPANPVYDLTTGTMVPGFQMLPSHGDGILRFQDVPSNPASSTALYGSLNFQTVIVVRGSDKPVATITWGYSNQASGYVQQPLVITPPHTP